MKKRIEHRLACNRLTAILLVALSGFSVGQLCAQHNTETISAKIASAGNKSSDGQGKSQDDSGQRTKLDDWSIQVRRELADDYVRRGRLFEQKGDLDRALADFTEAIRIRTELAKMADFSRPAVGHRQLASRGRPRALPKELILDLHGGAKLEMVLIPAGQFEMGSPESDNDAADDEKPRHRVKITKPFYLGKFPVTQAQWKAVTGSNPSKFHGLNDPVEQISWYECQQFIGKLNTILGNGRCCLPSEAQWEYACRAGSSTRYSFGDDPSHLGEHAWYAANAGGRTHSVGLKKPNAWGLYDMTGNVWEWCQDWYARDYYATSPFDDPSGPSSGTLRVCRGGGWGFSVRDCRSAYRGDVVPEFRHPLLGLRIACEAVDAKVQP
jgi:formylglycine-generating enzyme required for sulfatase activity